MKRNETFTNTWVYYGRPNITQLQLAFLVCGYPKLKAVYFRIWNINNLINVTFKCEQNAKYPLILCEVSEIFVIHDLSVTPLMTPAGRGEFVVIVFINQFKFLKQLSKQQCFTHKYILTALTIFVSHRQLSVNA